VGWERCFETGRRARTWVEERVGAGTGKSGKCFRTRYLRVWVGSVLGLARDVQLGKAARRWGKGWERLVGSR
jgi:hypothetical protein